MNHREAYLISLTLAVIGLGIIQVSSQKIMPEEVDVSEIDASMSGDIVSTRGEIVSKGYSKGNLFMTLRGQEENITVVKFDTGNRFEEDQKIRVEGEIAIYRGKLEIIASKIENME